MVRTVFPIRACLKTPFSALKSLVSAAASSELLEIAPLFLPRSSSPRSKPEIFPTKKGFRTCSRELTECSIMVVYTLREGEVRVRFSALRQKISNGTRVRKEFPSEANPSPEDASLRSKIFTFTLRIKILYYPYALHPVFRQA